MKPLNQNNMENSAVEWFASEIKGGKLITNQKFKELLEQAKEMEKQQIIDAHFAAQIEDIRFWDEAKQEALDYYNETFKSE